MTWPSGCLSPLLLLLLLLVDTGDSLERVLGVHDHSTANDEHGEDGVPVDGDPEHGEAEESGEAQLDGGGEGLDDRVEVLEEDAGNNTDESVVDDDGDD